jgi:hypothetical protein
MTDDLLMTAFIRTSTCRTKLKALQVLVDRDALPVPRLATVLRAAEVEYQEHLRNWKKLLKENNEATNHSSAHLFDL